MRPERKRFKHKNPYNAADIHHRFQAVGTSPWPNRERTPYAEADLKHMAKVIGFALEAYASGDVDLPKTLRIVQAFSLETYEHDFDSRFVTRTRELVIVGITAELALGIQPKRRTRPIKISKYLKYLAGYELDRVRGAKMSTPVASSLKGGDTKAHKAAESVVKLFTIYDLGEVKVSSVRTWGQLYNREHGTAKPGRPPKA